MTRDSRDHAVAQAIAAECLEGWRPTDEHVSALTALAHDEVSFDDYLAKFRDRYPAQERRRRRPTLRSTPYYIPGTTLLRNNFGAQSAEMLADLEFVATAGRMVSWLCGPCQSGPDGLDVRAIHGHLCGDVYSWAGKYRTTELRRGQQSFALVSSIPSQMTRVHETAQAVVEAGSSYDNPRLAWELARLYTDYNQVHPFRDGNGRAGAMLLHGVAARCGRTLDLTVTRRAEWYSAAADSMGPRGRDGRTSHRPFLPIMNRAVS
ncbi:MAG TPA: Fic family protein [Mycobacterium sp.]